MTYLNVTKIDSPNVLVKFPRPVMVMVAGVPGAGKTTLMRRALPGNAFLMSADDYRGRVQWERGQAWEGYDPMAIPMARANFIRDANILASHKVNLFLDASYLTAHSQREMCEIALANGLYPELILVTATLSECLEGVENRDRTVPKELVEKFYGEFLHLQEALERHTWHVPLKSVLVISRRASNSVRFEI